MLSLVMMLCLMNPKTLMGETMVSRLDFGSKQTILNQELKMEDQKNPWQMQENSTMVEEDLIFSYFFWLMLIMMNPILLWSLWMVKIHNIKKKAMDFKFQSLQDNKIWIFTPFHMIANYWVANGSSRSNILLMALWLYGKQGTRLIWWWGDLHKLKVLISMKPFPLLHECKQFELCL